MLLRYEMAIELVLCVSGLLLMWQVLFRNRTWAREEAAQRTPLVSVVIPARNEAQRIGQLLCSLKGQTVKPCEIVVVDDNSSDSTIDVARARGAAVIPCESLPEGWNGKAWACWQGACASSGEILLFLDADTWLEYDGLERLARLYDGRGLLSIQPYHVTEKAYEQLSAFFNIVEMAAVGVFTPLGERVKPGGAFGPCVMCSREQYFRTGGHRQVRRRLLEDIPLGKLFLRHNLPVRCYAGRGIISFRMYPGGLWELVEGWSKGMGFGLLSVHPSFSIMTAAWIVGCFGVFAGLIRTLTLPAAPPAWTGLLMYAVCAFVVGWILRGVGRFRWWTAALFPIPLCFFGVVVVRSLLLTYLLRRVVWKGRAMSPTQHLE